MKHACDEFQKDYWNHDLLKTATCPSYILDRALLEENLKRLKHVQDKSGAKIILALKGFAWSDTFDLVRRYLPGCTASSLYEAELAHHHFKGEVHVCSPAYRPQDFSDLVKISHHITFNSLAEWHRYKDQIEKSSVKAALRINPEHSEVTTALYDPCAKGSRLGITVDQLNKDLLKGISGLHFHTLCELGSDALERTLAVVEKKFSHLFSEIQWINFGGGHHITRADYDVEKLITLIKSFKSKTGLQVYLEPGEAIGLNTGILLSSVLDLVQNGNTKNAILDVSATNHMPDVLEMPYRPRLFKLGNKNLAQATGQHLYRLTGPTCLAGDVIGDYAFEDELQVGDRLIFLDMAHYTIVKTTFFNGVHHPALAESDLQKNQLRLLKEFSYQDYESRVGSLKS